MENRFSYERVINNCKFDDELKTGGVYSLVYGASGLPYYDGKHYENCLSRITKYTQRLNDKDTYAYRGHIWEFVLVLNQILNGDIRWENEYSTKYGKKIPNYFLDWWIGKDGRCYNDGRINWVKTKIMFNEMIMHGKISAALKSTDYYSEAKFIQDDWTDSNIEHTGTDVNRNLQKQEEEEARIWLFNKLSRYGRIEQPIYMEKWILNSRTQMWKEYPNRVPDNNDIYKYE